MLPTTSAARLLFSDDFSSGDVSKHNAEFRWGNGVVPFSGEGAENIEVVAGPNGKAVHARRFHYGTWQEQRFHLTKSVNETRSQNGASQIAHQEVWVSYWMKVPPNYHHRTSKGKAGHNNKGWLYLWKDGYERWHSNWTDDDTVTPTSLSLHWWPFSEKPGATRVAVLATRYRTSWGQRNQMTTCAPERQVKGANPRRCLAFTESEYGRWVRYTFGMRASSSKNSKDGFVRVYADGKLAMALEGLDTGGNGTQNGFDRGYLLGYHNSGYDQGTTFYITDFRIGTTAAAVGLSAAPVNTKRPEAPVLFEE